MASSIATPPGTSRRSVDGLAGVEGSFLPCSFWLADALAGIGRTEEARALFARLVALSNDLGLIAEEYDPIGKRLLGNFPQAFTHLALINTAVLLASGPTGLRVPTTSRADETRPMSLTPAEQCHSISQVTRIVV
jgi:hypothetical protein